MVKCLLTGGSGFIASHVLACLIRRGYTVVTTVRSNVKGSKVLLPYESLPAGTLSFSVVDDISQEGAFNKTIEENPDIEYVIHTASPFHNNISDPIKDLLNPAVNGTRGILEAIKLYGKLVKRVVITSSFAAIVNTGSHPFIYDEKSWNPVTWEEAINDHSLTYRGSKTFAEREAWKFLELEQPDYDLVVMNPPLVYGPVMPHIHALESLNTSNQRVRDIVQGKCVEGAIPPTGTFLWTDVRDLALAHVRAIEVPEAGNSRYLITAGHYSNRQIVEAIRKTHPDLLPSLPINPVDDFPPDVYGYDNSKARDILGIKFRTLEESISDTVESFKQIGVLN
ncbi:Ketoreductase azaE [Penicillium angulare]|uniref:Ketoreductase azaE n=1 Tax=Penicillium angulare TaxID=116970 RepID=A0A9W9KJQ6_9EURO|nr:Ketoreductase azaE [Penicillium angulare]